MCIGEPLNLAHPGPAARRLETIIKRSIVERTTMVLLCLDNH
jgi:hypothetical protein